MSAQAPPTPVVFIHGLWMHSSSWRDWISLFEAAGYPAIAPGWPGESPPCWRRAAIPRR